MRRLALVTAAVVACTPMKKKSTTPDASWPAADEAFIAQSAATFGFRLGHPQEITIAPDGDVLFTRTEARGFVADLYVRDAGTGEVSRLLDAETLLGGGEENLSPEEKARRERMRKATRGIGGFQLSKDGKIILVPLGDRLFVVDRDSGKSHELDTGEGFPYDPRISPAGDRIAYVVDGDLWTAPIDPAKGGPRRMTTRPGPEIEHGVAEFVAQEEMDRTRGFWWSPDGGQLLYQKTDVSPVATLYVSDPAHPDEAPTPFRYPRAGTDNAIVSLGVMAAKGGDTTWIDWDHAAYPYLCTVRWDEGAPPTLVVMNRAQTELAVLAVDVVRGSTRVLLTETDDAWLNLDSDMPRWLADGSGFLWTTERRGGWQLELRKADGSLDRELTPVELGMQGFAGYDAEGQIAWITASTDPTQTQVYTVPLSGGAPGAVTTEEGVHGVAVADHGGWVTIVSATRAGDLRFEVHDRAGALVASLPSVAEAPPWTPNVEWTTATVDGRVHHAVIVRPRAFDAKRRYPVLLHVYAGPHARMVAATPRAYLLDQWYADAGFVVVAIDGRGTPNRGREWERVVHKDLITIPLGDQVDVLQALGGAHAELDLTRVGVFGWSFGGYVSAMAALLRPDVFKAAVAGAPVTDWGLYDTFYTERYMQTPQQNPDGYKASSAITHAAELERPLLIIHGTTDDNVHFANSLALVEELFRKGKSAEVELLPVSATHMTPDPQIALSLGLRQLDFFREHL